MDEQMNEQRELTEEEKKNPVSSGAVEWIDPLEKPDREQPTGKLALASLLLGIAAMCMMCAAPAAILMGIAGLTCGIVSGAKHEDAKGLRIVGIVLSSCAIGVAVISLIIHVVLQVGSQNAVNYYYDFEQNAGLIP